MTSLGKPKLSDPGSTARIGSGGHAPRDKPVFHEQGGEGEKAWKVEITPLPGVGGLGRNLEGGSAKGRAMFEIRAEYMGHGLPEFGWQEAAKRIESFNTPDLELARAVAIDVVGRLRAGEREINLNVIAERVRR